ncbi:TPA: AAA family ATPase [Photobacterium damselae]
MKITKIEVKKLFGVFDHSIPLKTEQNITILIGENGLGKTVMLEAINSFFSEEYDFFYNLDFMSFKFHFDNKDIWELTKKNGQEQALFISRMVSGNTNQKSKIKRNQNIEPKHKPSR